MEKIVVKDCELAYFEMCGKRFSGEITDKEFDEWYDGHCAKCVYMSEVCMFE